MPNPTPDPGDPHWDDYVAQGIEARAAKDDSQWRLGDLAAEVETAYRQGDLGKYADAIQIAPSTLRDYKAVAQRFAVRTANLTWSHFKVAAGQDDAEDWIDRAEAERWSVVDLREAIQAAKGCPTTPTSARVLAALEVLALVVNGHEVENAQQIVGALRKPQQERLLAALDGMGDFVQDLIDAIPAGVGEDPAPVKQRV